MSTSILMHHNQLVLSRSLIISTGKSFDCFYHLYFYWQALVYFGWHRKTMRLSHQKAFDFDRKISGMKSNCHRYANNSNSEKASWQGHREPSSINFGWPILTDAYQPHTDTRKLRHFRSFNRYSVIILPSCFPLRNEGVFYLNDWHDWVL